MILKGSDLKYRDLLPGDVIRVIYDKSHPGNRTYHVRFWDEYAYLIVRVWSRRWQRWLYEGMTPAFWITFAHRSTIERVGNGK